MIRIAAALGRVPDHSSRRNSSIAAFTSGARSCWVQWPQPGSMIVRAELWDELRQIRDELIHAAEANDQIAVAGDVERGDGDAGPGERCQQLPVAIDVAVPVEPAAEPGARELARVEVRCRPR